MNLTVDHEEGRWFGLYPALVADLVDPEGTGRIQVKFPMFGQDGDAVTAWARLLTPYADDGHGLQVLPEAGTEVVVAFEAGDPRRPYIVGACWNGKAAPPEPADSANNLRTWKTRSGSMLQFDDSKGGAKITLSMESGHQVVLDDASGEVSVTHSNGCTIVMDMAGKITVTANSMVDVNASQVNLHAPTVMCDNLLQCQTLVATSVVSASYTPGAGNVW